MKQPTASADPTQLRRLRTAAGLAIACAATAMLFGGAGLAGWYLDVDLLKRGHAGLPPMAPNGGLQLVLAGVAVGLAAIRTRRRAGLRISRALATGVAIIAALTLVEIATRVDLHIDRALLGQLGPAKDSWLVRPRVNTNLAVCCVAGALLLLDTRPRWRVHPAELLSGLAMLIAAPTFVGYVFGAASDVAPRVPRMLEMSLPTSVALISLPMGILCARPDRGLMALVTSARPGGLAARRVVFGALAIPMLGAVIVTGVHAGLYDAATSAALVATTGLVGMIALVLLTAASLDKIELARLQREAELRASQAMLRESEERSRLLADWLNAVLDQMPEGVVILRHDGTMQVNRAVLRYAPEAPVNPVSSVPVSVLERIDLRNAAGEPLPIGELPGMRALEHGETTQDLELRIRDRDGRLVPILASSRPVRNSAGSVVGAVSAFRDISALKDFERMREEWTSIVAHDLRQPIGVISLVTQSLVRRADRLDEPTRQALGRLGNAGRTLNRMIEDLLDASRIEARRLRLELADTDIEALAREVVARQAHATVGHAVEVRAAKPVGHARVDPGRIEQVLGNLLSNAAKYGDAEAAIVVSVARSKDTIEVSVSNRGPGIDPAELASIFDRFRRAKGARGPGFGLGLYICKGLVEAHGGQLSVESVRGETTTFRFTLPAIADALEPARRLA